MVSLLSPQQIGIPVAPQMTAAVNPEGVKQGYTSPGGLFIPPIAPEEQKRQPQQIIQKPRSQAIPIVPPKVWYNFNGLCLGIGTVKPLITDPPKSGQPLYSRQLTCPRLILP